SSNKNKDTGDSDAAAPDKQAKADKASSDKGASEKSSGSSNSPTAHISDENMRKAHASPGVRRYAREHGADLSLISGTGPKERILKEDVVAFIKQSMEGMSINVGGDGVSGGAGIPPIPEVDFSKFGEIERVELGRINKLSAANLHRAWLNLPMVTHHELADITDMEAFRKQLKAEARDDDPKVTGLAFHMKALVNTLKEFPKMNSSMSSDGEALFYKKYYHVGIAVDTPNGLVVPVFRDVDKKSINQLAIEMADMSVRARNKKLKPDEMQGASMTISSLGGIGGTQFTPIVNAPEVGILGITRASMQPVWDGKDFIPRLMCPLDLTYDHRVIDGADAARFMAYYVQQISDIRRLML
ncbi:2-oxo acid dehydrogenase subunit E2, partial [Granulosicoccus sp.]|nr:2-oxo acid dehydrogenase subunit E2 [Granulosicoccus sp.]